MICLTKINESCLTNRTVESVAIRKWIYSLIFKKMRAKRHQLTIEKWDTVKTGLTTHRTCSQAWQSLNNYQIMCNLMTCKSVQRKQCSKKKTTPWWPNQERQTKKSKRRSSTCIDRRWSNSWTSKELSRCKRSQKTWTISRTLSFTEREKLWLWVPR